MMQVRDRRTSKRHREEIYLPPDFDEFVEWVDSLPISEGSKRTIIVGVKKAFALGVYSIGGVKALPRSMRGWKSMNYGMLKYEEFLSLKENFE